jgi:metal-responsive CopG/Arc/MetJ family transcriptional regulator
MVRDISCTRAAMQRMIELPDELAARVDEYLKLHEGETLSSLVQQMLEREVTRDERPSIRELAGLTDERREDIANRREFGHIVEARDPEALRKLIGLISKDSPRRVVPMEERQPEDRVIDAER